MAQDFTPVTSIDALEGLVTTSDQQPVVLFKHDPNCSISAYAYGEMQPLAEHIVLVDVEEHDDIAQAIAERTGIAHASPQIIVLNRGEVVWSADLYDITHAEIDQVLRRGA